LGSWGAWGVLLYNITIFKYLKIVGILVFFHNDKMKVVNEDSPSSSTPQAPHREAKVRCSSSSASKIYTICIYYA